jgi:CRISPR-associated endonuclease/helicase Cas3
LPDHWRHEALSVRLAMVHPRFAGAREDEHDKDLVLWLIGTHHGHGRSLFPHPDDSWSHMDLPPALGGRIDIPAGAGPQSLAFEWKGLDWPGLHEILKARYGVWELARMEAILRLADHRASQAAREKQVSSAGEKEHAA